MQFVPLPISNYALGVGLIVLGVLIFLKESPAYSFKHRSEYPAKVIGLSLFAMGVWIVVKEFRRRRDWHKPGTAFGKYIILFVIDSFVIHSSFWLRHSSFRQEIQ